MPELPEIRNLSRQIDRALKGCIIEGAEVLQGKCINRPLDEWKELVIGKRMLGASAKGKWCRMELEGGAALLLNLGMGGEFLLHEKGETAPEKRRFLLRLTDRRSISVSFWWFGSLHAVKPGEAHAQYDRLGTDALDDALTPDKFRNVYAKRRGAIKTLLLDQKLIAGMGNYYSHDILFLSGIHPLKRACNMTDGEYERLYHTMRETFAAASEAGGADYERDIYNRFGKWNRLLVGYRAGKPCPVCGNTIEEIRTGATTGFVCPECQKL